MPVISIREKDMVNHPEHYTQGKVECFDAMEAAFGKDAFKKYCKITAFKYLWRADNKGNEKQDVQKAVVYLNKFLSLTEGE